uniref:Uncharacterized protein n=1 Tax=Acrobeloides nanus TaxID=290746 RepID=A0A914CJ87_9BILA
MDQGLVDENREIEDGELISDEETENLLEPKQNNNIEVNGNSKMDKQILLPKRLVNDIIVRRRSRSSTPVRSLTSRPAPERYRSRAKTPDPRVVVLQPTTVPELKVEAATELQPNAVLHFLFQLVVHIDIVLLFVAAAVHAHRDQTTERPHSMQDADVLQLHLSQTQICCD